MNDIISLFKKDLFKLINQLINDNIISDFNKKNLSIDYSSKSKKGDLSTNILIILIKQTLDKDIDIKDYVQNYLINLNYISKIEIAKVGFINLFLKKKYLSKKLNELINNKISYESLDKMNINIEFVSANPTGPIHIAHMRGAILGDVLSNIFKFIGHNVTKEYYVNDSGSQIYILGNSLYKRYKQLFNENISLSDNEYPGEYLIDLAKKIRDSDGDKWLNYKQIDNLNNYFQSFAIKYLMSEITKDLSLINVNFDKFTFESKIVEENLINELFNLLKEKNLIYEGFLDKPLGDDDKNWKPRKQLLFRSTDYLDNLDRPLKKDSGEWTYFANDSAYHFDKFKRGFDKLINVWGADHIGYIPRMQSLVNAITNNKNYLEIVICQIVRLIKNNQLLKMSKREGNFITIKEVFDQVGKDPLRYFMISAKSETSIDFDIDKVIKKNKDNPVFYCQYAFARASSVIRKSKQYKEFLNFHKSFEYFDESTISEFEWKIIMKLLSWPYVLFNTAETKQTHKITNYLEDLSYNFHSFWNKGKDDESLRFIDENNINKTITKLIWIDAFRKILNQAFEIIGIDSPETM